VVAAETGSGSLAGLASALKRVPTVVKVSNLGTSADGQAVQLQVLSWSPP
jgi:hypothetical protein